MHFHHCYFTAIQSHQKTLSSICNIRNTRNNQKDKSDKVKVLLIRKRTCEVGSEPCC